MAILQSQAGHNNWVRNVQLICRAQSLSETLLFTLRLPVNGINSVTSEAHQKVRFLKVTLEEALAARAHYQKALDQLRQMP